VEMVKNFKSFIIEMVDFRKYENLDQTRIESNLNSEVEKIISVINTYTDFDTSEYLEFFKKFNLLISHLPFESFSSFAKNTKYSNDMSNDLPDVIDHCIKISGLTWNEILKNKGIIKRFINLYDKLGGFIDVILYKLDDSYILGGFDKEWFNSNDGLEDLSIKYSYGYHQTTYGSLFIKSCFGNYEKYFISVIYGVIIGFFTTLDLMRFHTYDDIHDLNCFKIRGDVCIINFEDLYYLFKDTIKDTNEKISNLDEMIVEFSQYLKGYFDDVQVDDCFIEIKLDKQNIKNDL